jgi:hypothetical protein
MIRGESVDNPLSVLLHGGPGFPEMRLFHSFNAPLEKDSTVIYWEEERLKELTSEFSQSRQASITFELLAHCLRFGSHEGETRVLTRPNRYAAKLAIRSGSRNGEIARVDQI